MNKPAEETAIVPPPSDIDRAPLLVVWETTRACDLRCSHCRAEASPARDPRELSTLGAMRLMNDVRGFGPIVLALSGGDCLKRPDVIDLVEHGARIGLRVVATPAATPLATPEMISRLKAAGLARLAISLDGSRADVHDRFRGMEGCFAHAMRILGQAREAGLPIQVKTVIGRHNSGEVGGLAELMAELGVVLWEVIFLVPKGRASTGDVAPAEGLEGVFHQLYELSGTMPFDIEVSAARQYGIGRAQSVKEGDDVFFVSHTGEIIPSGFTPLSAGNVRRDDLVEVYRRHPLFVASRRRALLDVERLIVHRPGMT